MLIVFLYFSEFIVLLGAPLNQDYRYKIFLVVTFAMVFSLYLMIFLLKGAGKFSYTSLFVILFGLLGFLIGILNGWYIKDIVGDSLRFLSPFLAYFLGKNLFKKLTLDQIKSTFMIILKVLLYMLLLDLLYRVFSIIILGEPIVKYPDGGVKVPVIVISFFLFSWYYTPTKRNVLFSFFIIF